MVLVVVLYVKAFCFERTTTKFITPIGTLNMPPSCLQHKLRQESSQVMIAEQDCDIDTNISIARTKPKPAN